MAGTRLAYVVVKMEGTLQRDIIVPSRTKNRHDGKPGMLSLKRTTKAVPAGYLVYFPKGHVLRLKTRDQLEHYGLERKPQFINLRGLHNPESPLGKMMAAQDDAARKNAYQDMEQAVMQLAIAKSGPVIMPEQIKEVRFIQGNEFTTPVAP
jgi:hypothetical protein